MQRKNDEARLRPAPGTELGGALSSDDRHKLISEAAYERAQRRGFRGGDPVVDWLEAEQEVEARRPRAR